MSEDYPLKYNQDGSILEIPRNQEATNMDVDWPKSTVAGLGISHKRITKERYIELTKIATSIVDYARMHGVNRQEGCIVREIAEQYFNL